MPEVKRTPAIQVCRTDAEFFADLQDSLFPGIACQDDLQKERQSVLKIRYNDIRKQRMCVSAAFALESHYTKNRIYESGAAELYNVP